MDSVTGGEYDMYQRYVALQWKQTDAMLNEYASVVNYTNINHHMMQESEQSLAHRHVPSVHPTILKYFPTYNTVHVRVYFNFTSLYFRY